MANKNDDFLKSLLATFTIEADEHLKAISAGLLELEKSPVGGRPEIIEQVFREAHSLKGAARAVNLTEIESVCHALESVFAALKDGQMEGSRPLFELLQQAIDAVGVLLSTESTAASGRAIKLLTRQLDDALKGRQAVHSALDTAEAEIASSVATAPSPPISSDAESGPASGIRSPSQPGALSETIRVSTAKLGAVMRQAEELLSAKLAANQRAADVREIRITLAAMKKQRAAIQPALRTIEQSIRKGDQGHGVVSGRQELARLLEYVETENLLVKSMEGRIAAMKKSAEHDSRALAGTVDGQLHGVREMLMLPFNSLLEIFPRFVRELARDQGKEIKLAIQGSEIEIDRRILEQMKDPLIHILRNCIDHGIENPSLRREKHKAPNGTINVAITQKDGGKVEIVVGDDGAGIDVGKVRASAHRLGIASAGGDDKPDAPESLALVFQSGVSTSPIITDISGRGLGLAIVREKIERLGGTIEIESHPDAGTTFRMVVPLTLAVFRGLLVRASGQLFVIPLRNVECVVRVAAKDIRTVENREAILFGGQTVALAHLGQVLELSGDNPANGKDATLHVAILGLGQTRIAFQVDEVLGEQEVLVKTLGRPLARVRNVAGACVLGTGQVVVVLNVADLMKSAMQQTTAGRAPLPERLAETERRSILVVEDSITSRALLKNILESAGFRVTTAVDGADGYAALKTATFDLVVSDVEMPRMDGFDLTARIRSDRNLSQLPVVLVTALESREHREHGIDVGANAYIVKSSFDQSNLLEVVRKLL